MLVVHMGSGSQGRSNPVQAAVVFGFGGAGVPSWLLVLLEGALRNYPTLRS